MTIFEKKKTFARAGPSKISAILQFWVFCPITLQFMSGNTKNGNKKMNWRNVSRYNHNLETYIYLPPSDEPIYKRPPKDPSHKTILRLNVFTYIDRNCDKIVMF